MPKKKKKVSRKTWLYVLLGVAAVLLILWFIHIAMRSTTVTQQMESICTVVNDTTIRCDCDIVNNNEHNTYSNLLTSDNGCDNSMCNDLCSSYADFLAD